jgi:hypothetical protein
MSSLIKHKKYKAKYFFVMSAFLLTGLSLLYITSCYYDNKEYLYPQINNTCDTTNVTFSVSVQTIFQNNCLSCHGGSSYSSVGGNIRLDTYAGAKAQADNGNLLNSIMHTGNIPQMPLSGGSINSCSIAVIKKWMLAKTPNN